VPGSRSRSTAALTLAVTLAAGASMSAHRKDEYLQAARLAIDPGRVQIELDLTPGIAVADRVLADIDADGDAEISTHEAQGYAARVRDALRLDVDGRPLALKVTGTVFPAVEAVRGGEGTIRMTIVADVPPLSSGGHHLRFGNAHRPDIAVYLANALVPASPRVAVTDQQRDVDQRHLDIAYEIHAATAGYGGRAPMLDLAGLVTAVGVLWLAKRRSSRTPPPAPTATSSF
jgi:hypothetical protein